MRTKVFLWTLVGCLVAPSIATAQDVYFSMGNEIRKITLPSTTSSPVFTSTLPVGDLALCAGDPDVDPTAASSKQFLYFVERDPVAGDRIRRRNVGTGPASLSIVVGPLAPETFGKIGELRLTERCEVIFTTEKAGVRKVGTTTPLAAALGSGLAVAFDGSLRYSDGNDIESVKRDGTTGTGFTNVTVGPIVGLGIANGGAGSDVDLAALSLGAVCASTLNTLVCAPKGGAAPSNPPLATFNAEGSSAGTALYFEFLTDDTAIVATSFNPTAGIGGTNKFNGILWKVTSNGPEEVLRAPKATGSYPPIVGVAVGKSSSELVTTSTGTQHTANFGPLAFDVSTNFPCQVTLQFHQLSWSDVKTKLNSVSSAQNSSTQNVYVRDPGLGGESWVDSVEVKEAEEGTCGLSDQAPVLVGLNQFNNPGPNKALLHCDGDDCTVTTLGNYPFFTFVDPRDSGTADDFSHFLTAQTVSPDKKILFNTPLSNDAIVQGAIDPNDPDITTHNANGGVSIRFRICSDASCKKFDNAEPANPTLSGAGLSIAAIDANGDSVVCEISDSGNSTPLHPVFRVSEKTHNFNVNTPPGGPPLCQLANLNPGDTQLFVATAFSYGGNFNKTSILFRLQK